MDESLDERLEMKRIELQFVARLQIELENQIKARNERGGPEDLLGQLMTYCRAPLRQLEPQAH